MFFTYFIISLLGPYTESSFKKHHCRESYPLQCEKCKSAVSSVYYSLYHKCDRKRKKVDRSRPSSRRTSISSLASSIIPIIPSLNSDESELFFLRQRVKNLESIIKKLSSSILELSSKIPNQVSQVSIPNIIPDFSIDPFTNFPDINTVAVESCSSANQNIALNNN